MITRQVHPDLSPFSWKQFCKECPPYSIALDGFVGEGPNFSPEGPHLNLNHHEGVSRLETRATCAQALMAVRQGLYETFSQDGEPNASLWVNDCDEDVCLSVFILENPHLVRSPINPALNRLVYMEDMLDTTAGSYAFPRDLPSLGKLMWVFEPFHVFRQNGGTARKDSGSFEAVITDVGNRIMTYITGEAKSIKLDTRYEVISSHGGWALIKPVGLHARLGAFADGHKAFVLMSYLEERRYRYSYNRLSEFVPFPLQEIYRALNEAEGLLESSDRHGGSSTTGGSPRVAASTLPPSKLSKIINGCLVKS